MFDRISYYKSFREKNKVRIKEQKIKYESKSRMEIFILLGEKCVLCGFSDKRALQIDHINGDGFSDKNRCRNSSSFRRRVCDSIKKGENRYQILCANCNWIKRHENNEHIRFVPHKR